MMSFLHVGRSNLFVYNEKFDYIRILLFSIFYQIGAIFFVTFIVSKFLKIWIIYIFSILLTILIIYYQLPHQITLLTTPLPNGNYDYVVYNMQTFAELSVRPCVTTMVKQKGSPDYFNLGNKKIIKEIRRVNSICIDYSRKPNFQNFEYPLWYNYTHECFSRDMHYGFPTLQFRFSFILPNPRKQRLIVERDAFGRIIHSKPPSIQL
jgi:hypothetical protein